MRGPGVETKNKNRNYRVVDQKNACDPSNWFTKRSDELAKLCDNDS